MVRVSKTIEQSSLNDKNWWKKFAEEFKKDIKRPSGKKVSSQRWVSEIICTQEDIGEPSYPPKKRKAKNSQCCKISLNT